MSTAAPTKIHAPGVAIVIAALEALVGRRSLHQVRPRLDHEAFVNLARCADSGTFKNAQLGRIRFQMPSPHALEATTRIQDGPRWLACTMRVDLGRHWTCTDLQVLGVTV